MLYMTKTADLQADESIDCTGIAEVDAAKKPWALLVLDEDAAAAEAGWRLVGTYAVESDAVAAHRRLSQSMKCDDYDALARSSAWLLAGRTAGEWRRAAAQLWSGQKEENYG